MQLTFSSFSTPNCATQWGLSPFSFSSSSQVLVTCEGLTSAYLMGHLAKYNLKPPPHGHAQALHCAPSVCQHLQLTHFLPGSVHAVQRAHLHSRSRSLHSTPLILAWSRLIRSRHTMRVRAQVCYSCPSSKANYGEPSHFSNAWDGGQEFLRARKVADSEDIINRVNSASLSMGVELAVGVCSWRDSTQRRQNRPASVSKLHHL